ncbi:MAG: hypothetical protein F6K65_27685 [Moorea sp. SIO3C2]|nr:hypothetical protein [Moorena sp. SIO3C2]
MRETLLFPFSLFHFPSSLLPAPCSLLPAPCSLKTRNLYLTSRIIAIDDLTKVHSIKTNYLNLLLKIL